MGAKVAERYSSVELGETINTKSPMLCGPFASLHIHPSIPISGVASSADSSHPPRSFHSQFGSTATAQTALFMRELIRSDVLHPI